MANHPLGQYRTRERNRFTGAIARAVGEDTGRQDRTD